MKAYLNVWIRYPENSLPILVGAGIYSKAPEGLTYDQRMGCACLRAVEAADFDSAIDLLIDIATAVPSMQWTLPFLQRQHPDKFVGSK